MGFDEGAASWDDDPARGERARAVAAAMRRHLVAFRQAHDETTGLPPRRAIDLGAGTGSLSLLLADLFDEIVLVDTSAGMLEVAAAKVAADPTLPARFETLRVDLASSDTPPIEPVEAAYSLLALHHIDDVGALLRGLHALLMPGGLLLLADLVTEDGSYHRHDADFHGHHGFDRDGLEAALRAAGFEPLTYEIAATTRRRVDDGSERDYPLFLITARAERPR